MSPKGSPLDRSAHPSLIQDPSSPASSVSSSAPLQDQTNHPGIMGKDNFKGEQLDTQNEDDQKRSSSNSNSSSGSILERFSEDCTANATEGDDDDEEEEEEDVAAAETENKVLKAAGPKSNYLTERK